MLCTQRHRILSAELDARHIQSTHKQVTYITYQPSCVCWCASSSRLSKLTPLCCLCQPPCHSRVPWRYRLRRSGSSSCSRGTAAASSAREQLVFKRGVCGIFIGGCGYRLSRVAAPLQRTGHGWMEEAGECKRGTGSGLGEGEADVTCWGSRLQSARLLDRGKQGYTGAREGEGGRGRAREGEGGRGRAGRQGEAGGECGRVMWAIKQLCSSSSVKAAGSAAGRRDCAATYTHAVHHPSLSLSLTCACATYTHAANHHSHSLSLTCVCALPAGRSCRRQHKRPRLNRYIPVPRPQEQAPTCRGPGAPQHRSSRRQWRGPSGRSSLFRCSFACSRRKPAKEEGRKGADCVRRAAGATRAEGDSAEIGGLQKQDCRREKGGRLRGGGTR